MSTIVQQKKIYSFLVLFLIWIADQSVAEVQVAALSKIHTLAKDSGTGIQSKVRLTRGDDKQITLGTTGKDGILILKETEQCHHGMILEAEPISSGRHKRIRRESGCEDPEILMLPLIKFAEMSPEAVNLLSNIDYAFAVNDSALAALLYNDLAAQVTPVDQDLAHVYARRAVFLWAHVTNFNGKSVESNNDSTLTPQFAAHVKQFQRTLGLAQTGHLDYSTFAEVAKRDVVWFRHLVHRNPGSVPTRAEPFQCARPTWNELTKEEFSPLVEALIGAAKESERAGEHGNAALLFNEARARVGNSSMMAYYLDPRIYENAGHAMGVSVPVRCDPIQRRFVMTPTMWEAVRARQLKRPTGILDYRTIRSLAHIDVGPFLAQQ